LERVCSDGSSKFPKFTVPTINRLIAEGRDTERAALVVAAWALYLQGVDENGVRYRIPDPRADFCRALVADDALISQRLLGVEEIFGTAIPNSAEFVAAFERCFASLRDNGVTETLKRLTH
jgi:mannitol 2-dehydrogenase